MLAETLATPVAAALARVVVAADLPPPDHTPAEARDAADRVLDRPEYRWDDDQNVVQRIVEWIAERFADLLEPLGFGAGGLPVWVGWLILLGLAGLVGYLVYRARGGWGRAGAPGVVRGGRVVVSAGEADVDWAAEVERCERAGLWRDALRARYRVLVGELAARGLIGDLVGRTTGELVADVRVVGAGSGAGLRGRHRHLRGDVVWRRVGRRRRARPVPDAGRRGPRRRRSGTRHGGPEVSAG